MYDNKRILPVRPKQFQGFGVIPTTTTYITLNVYTTNCGRLILVKDYFDSENDALVSRTTIVMCRDEFDNMISLSSIFSTLFPRLFRCFL